MIRLGDVFADFQIVNHKILLSNFKYPKKNIESDKELIFEFDYEVVKPENQEKTYIGTVLFQVIVSYEVEEKKEEFLECIIEGTFVGNPNAMDFENFKNMLSINGVATLSQLMRAHIQNFTLMTNLKNVISIPMINVIELNKLKEKELEKSKILKSKGKK